VPNRKEDFRRPEIKIGGEDLVIMTEGDVMGVIDQTGAKKKAA
jgi:co-chaperonin GroES (HSP10)